MNLKVVCLNLWFGGKLFENIKTFIAQENPDIIGLQEVYQAESADLQEPWHAVSSLASILGYRYYAFAPTFAQDVEDGYRVQFGNAVLSRYPIRSARATFYDVPYEGNWAIREESDIEYTPRNLQHAEIIINDKILHVFNTQGIWGFNGDDTDRRLQMGDSIVKEISGKQPALLMGDFNLQEGGKTTDKIEKHMHSIFKGEMKTSFNMSHKDKPGYATAIVDMIFASPDIRIGKHYVSTADVSDHLALVAEVEVTV